MKTTNRLLAGAVGLLLLLLCASVYTQVVVNRDKEGFLEDRNWRDGSVVTMTFIRTRTGQDLAYLNALADTWKKQQEALKGEGIILSYKVWQGNAASEEDFNIILMSEYKDFRVMEENADKQTVIFQTIARETQASAQVLSDDKVREFFGVRTGRTIVMR
jgi:hypothetical protein